MLQKTLANAMGMWLSKPELQQHRQLPVQGPLLGTKVRCTARRARQHRILQALGEQGFRQLRQAAQVLCLACSLDQRAGLQRSRDAAKSQHISGLVEQVSCTYIPSCLTPLSLGTRATSP